ncbi:hypothetical protein, partial [Helicobacter sp. T3_23-1059]
MAISFDLSLLVGNKMPMCSANDSEYVKYKTIYLGIESNILSIDDRIYDKYFIPNLSTNAEKFRMKCSAPSRFKDFTATLYLGKIIFEKNKKGILAPKFIPSNLTDSSFEGLNTFWLNEINKKAKKPFRSFIKCERLKMVGTMCLIDADSIPYQKIHYFRHKD